MTEPLDVSRRTTMKDVAERANVSVATVSKVLHGRADVGHLTAIRVRDALRELDYVEVGRPAAPRATSIVIAFDSFGHEYGTAVLAGVMRESAERGFRVVLDYTPTASPDADVVDWVVRHTAAGVRAAVLIAGRITPELVRAAAERDLALIAIDPKNEGQATVTTIGATNWAGAAGATNYLIGLGHRAIAFAGLDLSVDYSVERFSGYKSALDLAGIPHPLEYVAHTDLSSVEKGEDGMRMGAYFVRLPTPPTAVVAFSDSIAFGVIEGARQNGVATPEELSVVGFDDIPAARRSSPLLTTVHQPLADMGAIAIRTIADMLKGEHPPTRHLQLATSLIVRNSSGPPRA